MGRRERDTVILTFSNQISLGRQVEPEPKNVLDKDCLHFLTPLQDFLAQVCQSAMAREIDSEDEAWEGVIDPSIFQQVRDEQEKARIIAKLEAQNRPKAGLDTCV